MTDNSQTGDRIAKVMARAGVASRRDAERLILEGRVAVNGQTVTSPALDVAPTDRVTLDGKPIDAPQPARLWLYYKPLGLVTSEKDEKGRQTVFESLPDGLPRVMSVGRLDLNSEGLLLLTNDGGLKRRLELPSTGWLRKYRVRVNGRPNEATFDPLRRGVTIDGEDFLPMDIALDRQQGANAWLTVGLREGKNREVRRAMTEVGLTVNRLIRVSYGPFRLNEMKPGDVIEVKQKVLKEQLGDGTRPKRDDRPARDGGSDRPRGPRREGGAPDRRPHGAPAGEFPRKPRPQRTEGSEGHERKPRHPRPDGSGAARRKPEDAGATGYDRKPRPPRSESGASDRKPRTPRAEGSESRPPKPYARRADQSGGDARKSYPPRGEGAGDRERKPRAPHSENGASDRKPRTPRAEGSESRPPKPYARRADQSGGDARKSYPSRGEGAGDRERKPRAPRSENGASDRKPRTPRAESGESRPPKPYARRADQSGGDARKSYPSRGEGAGDRERKPRFERKLDSDDPSRKPRASSGAGPTGSQDRKPRAAGGPAAGRGPRKDGGFAGGGRGPKGPAANRPDQPDRNSPGRGPRPPHGGKGKPGRK